MEFYGSLTNRLQEAATRGQPQPVIGMGATFLSYTDRHPGTIVSIEPLKNGKTRIGVQGDRAKRIDNNGMSECQTYEYSPNPNDVISFYEAELPNGRWQAVFFNERTKRWNKSESGGLRIGERDKYHDFSF